MKIVYEIILIIVLLFILFCFFKFLNNRSNMAKVTRFMLLVTSVSVLSNMVIAWSVNPIVCQWAYNLFYASVDGMLLLLAYFTTIYVGRRISRKSPVAIVIISLAVLDTINLLLNIYFHHVYTIYKQVWENMNFIGIYRFFWPYYAHLAFCYLLALIVFVLLLVKLFKTPSFYRQKYYMILAVFSVVLLADGISVVTKSPLNFGVVFYGVMVIFICYYSLSFISSDLTSNTVRLAVDNMDSGVICFDIEGKCAFTNPGLWQIFRVDPLPSRAEEMFVERCNTYNLDQLDTFRWNEKQKLPFGDLYLECEYHKMYDKRNHYVGSYFHIQDISQRIAEYEEQVRKAEADSKAKSEFVSKISHEIRTPINSVYGMDEMILRESTEPNIIEYANDIKNSAEIMISIINDVLDYSKIESGKMELVEDVYSLQTMLDNIKSMISVRTKTKNLEFIMNVAPSVPPVMKGDMVRIEQIIINLLTNAVKYTNEGFVRLDVSAEVEDSIAKLKISVSDSGIGIKEENIPKLFIAYERLDEMKNHSIQGTGLGLNIVTQLLRLMNSRLEVESEYGHGSTFSFTIDQKIVSRSVLEEKRHEKPVATVKQSTIDGQGKSILIVDDNAINRKVIKGLLKNTKLTIAEANGGIDCLNMVQADHFDLIFLDHMMPDLDGVETFKKMKTFEDFPCKKTPVIMLTANAINGAKEEYLSIGFDDFLSKPVIPAQLEQIIEKYI